MIITNGQWFSSNILFNLQVTSRISKDDWAWFMWMGPVTAVYINLSAISNPIWKW